jgi:radical SAM superfamily enzyme YgiQ (UPF0313 family)
MGLGSLAGYVRQFGHVVAIFDPEAAREPVSRMWERVSCFRPDLIGITSVTAVFPVAGELAREAKRRLGCLVIMGGAHVSALPRSSLRAVPELDAVIRGEGEIPLREIAAFFDAHGTVDFSSVPGAAFFRNGEYHAIPRPPLIEDIEQLPPPARDLVDLSWYSLHPQFERGTRSATVLSSRGCPSRCTFCGNVTLGRRFRPLGAERFVEELATLRRQQDIRHFHIVDDCFTADPRRVEAICDLLIKRRLGITWFIFGRADTLQDPRLLARMRQAGCVLVLLGVESGNQRILDLMKKGQTKDDVRRCCRQLRRARIPFFNSFMIGNEGDTEETVRESVSFAKELRSVAAFFNILIPFPGTPLFHRFFPDYDRSDMDWGSFCAVGDDVPYDPRQTELRRGDILRLISWAHRAFYLDPAQLARLALYARKPQIFLAFASGGLGLLRQVFSWWWKAWSGDQRALKGEAA